MKPVAWMRAVRDSDLPTLTKAVACVSLGLRADVRDGNCWPTYQQIADDLGVSRSTAIRHIATLTQHGWIMAAQRSNGHGSQSNSYLLTLPHSLWKTQGGGSTSDTPPVAPVTPGGSTSDTPQGVAPVTPRRGSTKEVGTPPAPTPVDNRHLKAIIGGLAHQHRLPN